MSRRTFRSLSPLLALLVTLASCQAADLGTAIVGTAGSGARVRVINALATTPSVDLLVDGQLASSGAAFRSASPYVSIALGSHRLQLRASGSTTGLLDLTTTVSQAGDFTLLAVPGVQQFGTLLFQDSNDPPSSGQAKVRVIHAAQSSPIVDVFLTPVGGTTTSATPTVASLNFGAPSSYLSIAPGQYRVRATLPGQSGSIVVDTGPFELSGGTVRTLLLVDSAGGGPPPSVALISDRG